MRLVFRRWKLGIGRGGDETSFQEKQDRYQFKCEARDIAKEHNDAGYIVQVVKEEYHSRNVE